MGLVLIGVEHYSSSSSTFFSVHESRARRTLIYFLSNAITTIDLDIHQDSSTAES